MKWTGEFSLVCRNKGVIKWEEKFNNAITYLGERNILESYLTDQNSPSEFYIGLTGMASISRSTTLITLTNEISAVEYSRQLLPRSSSGWPQIIQDVDNNYQIISEVATFEALSTWTMVDKMFMATTADNSGILISYGNLSTARTLVINDVLDVTYKVKLS